MEPPSDMRPVFDRNVGMWRMTVLKHTEPPLFMDKSLFVYDQSSTYFYPLGPLSSSSK